MLIERLFNLQNIIFTLFNHGDIGFHLKAIFSPPQLPISQSRESQVSGSEERSSGHTMMAGAEIATPQPTTVTTRPSVRTCLLANLLSWTVTSIASSSSTLPMLHWHHCNHCQHLHRHPFLLTHWWAIKIKMYDIVYPWLPTPTQICKKKIKKVKRQKKFLQLKKLIIRLCLTVLVIQFAWLSWWIFC